MKQLYMKRTLALLISLFFVVSSYSQVELTTTELTGKYKSTTKTITPYGIHDPSVVWDPNTKYFYVFGSHYAGAKTKDFRTWTGISNYYKGGYDSANAYKAFKSCPTHNVNRCLPGKSETEQVELGSFDAGAFASIYSSDGTASWVSGCQWAPDIVYNPNTKKWNYYLSINGDNWASVIVLMTSDKPEGPYIYEAPVVFGGFNNFEYEVNGTKKKVNYKNTDLEVVLGNLSSLPGRYNKGKSWGSFWPNCIDPCVFFDEEGEMWLSYGSWSGGIWMLKLDKNTGLRDYTYTYSGTASSVTSQQKSDAYFGKLIAGGAYVSGEGSYIQHIGKYYYLFMSYGFYSPEGGYEMRIFRSSNPDGPYVDASNKDAINLTYEMNYGPKAATNKGMRLFGSYNNWGLQTMGELAQGHNSACIDSDGRAYVVCHTKFNNGSAAHAMRVHQLFQNKYGWLVAAPFVYNGETVNDDSIATTRPYSEADVAGDYHLLIHPYKQDYENYAMATEKTITLTPEGKIKGDYTGSWKYTDEGASYIQLTIGGVAYNGVVTEQTLQGTNDKLGTTYSNVKVLCFSAICNTSGNANCGVTIWGYKWQPQYAIAKNYNALASKSLKQTALSSVSKNVQLYYDTDENTELSWESSNPDVISNTGKYNPDSIDVSLTLTAKLENGNYYWTHTYNSKAVAAKEVTGDPTTGLVAYYDFDEKPTLNKFNEEEKVTYSRAGTGTTPTSVEDYSRFGKVVHQYVGDNGKNSYSRIPNPLLDKSFEGFTVSLWVKRCDATDLYNALWGFSSSTTPSFKGPRLYMTGNSYVGFNDNEGNWFDVNHPDTKEVKSIAADTWCLVTVTYSKTNGLKLYKDGTAYTRININYTGSVEEASFDRNLVLDFVKSAKYFSLGMGSFWGSAEAYFDDLMIYNRELSADDVKGLNTLLNRVNEIGPVSTSIDAPHLMDDNSAGAYSNSGIYDLYGRKVTMPSRGVYIVNGKKVLYK